MLLGVVFVSSAAVTVTFDSPVRADDACIEQPPQPVAEATPGSVPHDYTVPYTYAACHACHSRATEVLTWAVRYDRKGRKCWFLVDSFGSDVTDAHLRSPAALAPTPTLSSTLASLFGNFNFSGTPANPAPEVSAPQISPPPTPTFSSKLASLAGSFNLSGTPVNAAPEVSGQQISPPPTPTFSSKLASLFGNSNFFGTPASAAPEYSAPEISPSQINPPNPPRKHQSDTANANKTDSIGRAGQKTVADAHVPKRVPQVSIREEERDLFEEFLRWREREKTMNTLGPASSARQ
jgi:hypothetical protein